MANHRVLSTTTLLSTTLQRLSLHCTGKTLRELLYVSTEIQNIKQQGSNAEFRQQKFTAILCLHEFCRAVFCSCLLTLLLHQQQQHQPQQPHHTQISVNDCSAAQAKSLLPHRADVKVARCIPRAIWPTCSVSHLTGNKRRLNEKTH